ncbi:MAG: hypothetical protein GEV08_17170 [Acidimicrobiia bacterium]|nr:hypothetical protein [Acidimicrobiia bacterium]
MTTTVPGLLALALALGSLVGCSGDDDAPQITTTTIDEAAFAREQMCESLTAYTDQEDQGEPRLPSTNLDQAGPTTTAAPRVDPRLTLIERLEANLTEDVPADARAALEEMKELRSEPLDDSKAPVADAPTVDVVLPTLFDYLDPICGSVNGRDPSSPTTTTRGPGVIPTTAPTPTTAGAPTTTTTAA